MAERRQQAPTPGVDAVIFDWGGTLTPWHTVDVAEQWLTYASHYARDHPDHPDGGAALAEQMLEAERVAWERIRGDGGSATLEELLAAVGVDHRPPEPRDGAARRTRSSGSRTPTRPGRPAGLRRAARRGASGSAC